MVAHSGRNWRLAPSLIAMEDEANRLAPNRSKRSDGSIGDAAHSSRSSDHNPDGGIVDAIDLTHDPAGGFDAHGLARTVSLRNDPRIKYIISNGQIWNRSRGDRPGVWRHYSGSNKHTLHAHFSIMNSGRTSTDRWFIGGISPGPVEPPDLQGPPADEDEDMTQLIRSDPKQGGTGSVYAINGFFRQPVSPGDYPTWQFITGGPDKQAQLDPEGFDFFMRNTVEVNHINLSLMHNVGQTRALSEISEQIDSIPSSGGSVDAEKIVDEIAERLAE